MPRLRTVLAVVLLLVVIGTGSVTHAVSPALQEDPPTISVSGVIQYDTGSAHVPAEGLRVMLLDHDPLSHGPGEELARTLTDEHGRYAFDEIDNRDLDGPGRNRAGGQDVRVMVLTENEHVAVESMQARSYRWTSDHEALLGGAGLVMNVETGTHVDFGTIRFRDGVPNYQAIRAFNTMNLGWSFLVEEMELPDPGFARARWPTRIASDRGYNPDLQVSFLTAGDADFPDAVLHMQAHAYTDNILRSLGGSYPTDCLAEGPIGIETSQQCAWIHGFAVFFAAAAQGDPNYATAAEALNLESPLTDLDDGDAVTARVAGALLDLMDETNEGFDQYTGSFVEVWNIFASAQLGTFPDFWAAWVDGGLPECEPLTSLYQNTINYNTPPELDPFPDPVEMDEDPEDPPSFDMREQARDAECSFEKLLFDVEESDSDISVQLDEEGFLQILPGQDWNGEVTVNVRVFDGVDFTAQPLHVIVHSVNDEPRIAPPPDRTVKVGEEIVYQLDSRISDPDHPKGSLTLGVVPVQAQLQPPLDWEIDQENFVVRFIPQNLTAGTNAVEIVVTDPEGAAGRHTLLLTWEPLPNQPPTIESTIPEVWEATKGQTIIMDLLEYATDDRDEPTELDWKVDPETLDNATYTGDGDPPWQKLIFTPDPAGFLGDDDITLIVQDRNGRTSEVDVILRWTPEPNLVPFINPPVPDFITGINQQLVVDLSPYGHDPDDNDEGLRWYVQFADPDAPNPFVSGQGSQKLVFTPLVDFEGTIEAMFAVRDPDSAEASQLVNLTWQRFNVYMPLHMRPFQQKPTD